MLVNHIVLAVLWMVYCVLHSVLASTKVKTKMQSLLGNRFRHYRLFYTLFAFAGLIGILWFQIVISSPTIFQPTTALGIAGGLLTIAGVTLMVICIKKYFLSLSGLMTLFKEKSSNKLIITGVHRHLRHPLYLGTFVFIWGLLLLYPHFSLLIADTVITVYTLIGIAFEENKLVEEFGEDYKSYQESVPKLIPRWRSTAK